MPPTKLPACPDCGSNLGKSAYKCRCGWKAAPALGAVEHIDCAIEGCPLGARCRVFTKTGWANVCRQHYPTIERIPYIQRSPVVDEIRKAFENSRYMQRKLEAGVDAARAETGFAAIREPGQD